MQQQHERVLLEAVRERDARRRVALLQYAQKRNQAFQAGARGAGGRGGTGGPLRGGAGLPGAPQPPAPPGAGARSQGRTGLDWQVPVRLEAEHEGYRVTDVLVLGAGSSAEEAMQVAQQLCADFDVPGEPFAGLLARQVREQAEEAAAFHAAVAAAGGFDAAFGGERALHGPVGVRLDIIVGLTRLEDRIEFCPGASLDALVPGLLRSYAPLLAAVPEAAQFPPLILHNVLEQVYLWRRALLLGGVLRDPRTGALRACVDPELNALLADVCAPRALPTIRRHPAHFDTFTPLLTALSVDDLDRIEASRDRDVRRRRRMFASQPVSVPQAQSQTQTPSQTHAHAQPQPSPLASFTSSALLRSPPRTLPTPISYRGSLHRILPSRLVDDDTEGPTDRRAPRSRGRPRLR